MTLRNRRATALAALLAAAAPAACSVHYDTYDGSAWPDRRPQVALPDGGGPVALVSDNGSDTLSVVDLRAMRTLGRYPIGLDPVSVDGPHHIAVDPVERVVFTAFAYPPPSLPPGPHGNHGMSTTPGVVVRMRLSDLRVLARADADLNPGDVLLTPDRRRVLVSHYDVARALQPPGTDEDARRASMIVYDAATLRREGVVRVGLAAHGMAVTADSRTAFVACYGSDELAVVDLGRPEFPVERIAVGPSPGTVPTPRYGPYALTLSPDGATLYVSNLESREVRTYDVAARRFDGRAALLRAAPFFPAFGPGDATLIVPTQAPDGLVALRRDTLEIVAARAFTREECQRPHQVGRGPDGGYVLVCEGDHRGPGALLAFDPTTLEPRGRTELGVYPDAITFLAGEAR